MRQKKQKLMSLFLAIVLCFTALLTNTNTASAEETTIDTILEQSGTATANTATNNNFTLDLNNNVYFEIVVPAQVNCYAEILDSVGNVLATKTIPSTSFIFDEYDNTYYYDFGYSDVYSGDYNLTLTFDTDTTYDLYVGVDKILATISDSKVTLTAGFTKTIKVDNTKESIKWTSSKKSVATVDSKGKITAKKPGTATITATTASGQKLTCKVTVKANTYKETKCSAKDVNYGKCVMQVYNASYNKSGDLILKCRFINNSFHKVTSLENMKITFKTSTGKTVGTYYASKKSMSVPSGSVKDFTVTIKKSKLKIKKADLRNGDYSTSGSYVYYY